MIVLGLAGKAGSGKDTTADYLVKRYGFIKFAFSDALYREVAAAFRVDESILRNRETKEANLDGLALKYCTDKAFVDCDAVPDNGDLEAPRSPRWILQHWGTEYRRAQDPEYWVKATHHWMNALWSMFQYPEQRPQLFVNTTVRFENERAFIRQFTCGQIWHIHRGAAAPVLAHVSEQALEVRPPERELFNNDTIERLHNGIELLLNTQAKFVRVEPMLLDAPRVDEDQQGVA